MPPLPSHDSRLTRDEHEDARRPHGWRSLAVIVAAAALTWLAILPRVAEWPPVRAYIAENERLGIDPSAKFYTEMPLQEANRIAMDAARRNAPAAWWQPSPAR